MARKVHMVKINKCHRKHRFTSIRALADKCGIPYMTLYMRLRNGMTLRQAVNMPVRIYVKG